MDAGGSNSADGGVRSDISGISGKDADLIFEGAKRTVACALLAQKLHDNESHYAIASFDFRGKFAGF